MIELTNVDGGVSFHCSIVGYEFPSELEDEWYDVSVKIESKSNSFSVVDPALTVTELIELREWFDCLSKNKLPKHACLSFIEPNMEFCFLAVRNHLVRMFVRLSLEMKPDFELTQFGKSQKEWLLVFDVSSDKFASVLEGIDGAFEQFPPR